MKTAWQALVLGWTRRHWRRPRPVSHVGCTIYLAPCSLIPITEAAPRLRGLLQHVLSRWRHRATLDQLDCFGALKDKTLYAMLPEVVTTCDAATQDRSVICHGDLRNPALSSCRVYREHVVRVLGTMADVDLPMVVVAHNCCVHRRVGRARVGVVHLGGSRRSAQR